MACWLYQMSVDKYSHERYRAEVWEGSVTQNWTLGTSTHKPKDILPGDLVILFFARTGAHEPGIYGWGVVTFFDSEAGEMHFRPAPPSDYLKMNPVPEARISSVIDNIRDLPQGTVWRVDDKALGQLRQRIAEHVYGIRP